MQKKILLLLVVLVIALAISFNNAEAGGNLPPTIRVGLFYDNTAKTSYTLAAEEGFVIGIKKQNSFIPICNLPEKTINVTIKSGETTYVNSDVMKDLLMSGKYIEFKGQSLLAEINLPLPVDVPLYVKSAKDNVFLSLNGRRYRGVIEFLPSSNGGLTVINELGLEEYLYGVLPNEMPPSWPMEALKAQAVASRSYAVYNILKKAGKASFDVTGGTGDQVYSGYDGEHPRTNEAVDMTKGQVLTYKGKPILALYHSNSGGITENSGDAFGIQLPYLKSVNDEFSLQAQNGTWVVKIPQTQVYDLEIIEKSASGRVKKLLVRGIYGEKVLSGTEIRNALQLKSNLFEILADNVLYITANGKDVIPLYQLMGKTVVSSNKEVVLSSSIVHIMSSQVSKEFPVTGGCFEIRGKGNGHGVGLSQWGAKVMAENGYTFKEILLHYYTDVELN
jgi:stage II sporulation protein D